MWFRKKKYIRRKACFACTTPYQLLGAINIVQNLGLEADLYLFGLFEGYQSVAKKLQQEYIFVSVVPVDCSKYRSVSMRTALWQVLNSSKEVSTFLAPDISYDYIYSTSKAHAKLLLFYTLRYRNPNVRYVYYEDGIGTYYSNSHQLNKSRRRRFSEILIGGDVFVPGKTSFAVRFPNLLDRPENLKDAPVIQLAPLEVTLEFENLMDRVFSLQEQDMIDERVIIFDTARGVYGHASFDLNLLDCCFNEVLAVFGNDKSIIKPHPKSKKKTAVNIREYPRQGVPVEALYIHMEDLESRVLIGNLSTAQFSPKLLFGKEPYVISLHKIAWAKSVSIDAVFHRIANMYENKEKVFAPESITELKIALSKIK